MNNKKKGYSLVELSLVITVIAILVIFAVKYTVNYNNDINKRKIYAKWGGELMQIYDALDGYVGSHFSTLALDTTSQINTSTLITEGFLPSGFAVTPSTSNVSPLGARYQIGLRKYEYDLNNDGNLVPIVSAVIYHVPFSGNDIYSIAKLAKINIKLTPINKENITKQISLTLFNSIKTGYQGGWVNKLTNWITGINGSFDMDFSDYIAGSASSRDYIAPALVWGFPSINGCGGGVSCGGDGGGAVIDVGNCFVQHAPIVYPTHTTQACLGSGESILYSTYPHPTLGYSAFESVEGFGIVGWKHSQESIQVLADFSGPRNQCNTTANMLRNQGLPYYDNVKNACYNTVVVKKIDSLFSSGGDLASKAYQIYGNFKFPRFDCSVQDPNTPWVDRCGGQSVTYSVNNGHQYFSICCH